MKPRTYVSNPCERNLPEAKVEAHCFTNDVEKLVSIDTLTDVETGIETRSLKFW